MGVQINLYREVSGVENFSRPNIERVEDREIDDAGNLGDREFKDSGLLESKRFDSVGYGPNGGGDDCADYRRPKDFDEARKWVEEKAPVEARAKFRSLLDKLKKDEKLWIGFE